jgi:hypothetical protein
MIESEAMIRRFLHRPGDPRCGRFLAPGAVLELPAHSAAMRTREHRGRVAMARAAVRINWLTRGTLRLPVRSIARHGEELVAHVHATARRRGREPLDIELEMAFTLAPDGRIAAIRETTPDLEAWQTFWG